jgi:hypothetical protein
MKPLQKLAPHEVALANALAAHQQFSRTAKRAVDELRNLPDRAGLRHTLAAGGVVEEFHLIRGVWVDTICGCKMMLVDEKKQCNGCESCEAVVGGGCGICTRVLCEADKPIRLPAHSHHYSEMVTIIKGSLIEHIAKDKAIVLRRASDKIFYAAGETHEPEIYGLMMICWTPPLANL